MDYMRGTRRHGGTAPAILLGAVLLGSLIYGCTSESPPAGGSAEADSVAYAQAMAVEDETARVEALTGFLEKHPNGPWAGRAYYRTVHLGLEHDPAVVEPTLQKMLSAELPDPGAYNAVGWELAEAGEHLDLAIRILQKGVAKAREDGADKETLGSLLDSEAWALHKKGDHTAALQRMEEAYQLLGPGQDEVDEHMAAIYDASGAPEKALPIYVSLLGHMEHPRIRARVEEIVKESGGSVEEIRAEILATRKANMAPAPDFSLPSLADGSAVSLADHRGKVVLLNFWHPT